MKKTCILYLLCLLTVGINTVTAQNNIETGSIKTVPKEAIRDPFGKMCANDYYGCTKILPYIENRSITLDIWEEQQKQSVIIDNVLDEKMKSQNLPFNTEGVKENKAPDWELTTIRTVFYDTSGDYMIALLSIVNRGHTGVKNILLTVDFDGNILDYVVFRERYDAMYNDDPNSYADITEGELYEDLTVRVFSLVFPDHPYLVEKGKLIFPQLRGQRVDRTYQISPKGKFQLTQETKYKPKIYTPVFTLDKKCIKQRDETPIRN